MVACIKCRFLRRYDGTARGDSALVRYLRLGGDEIYRVEISVTELPKWLDAVSCLKSGNSQALAVGGRSDSKPFTIVRLAGPMQNAPPEVHIDGERAILVLAQDDLEFLEAFFQRAILSLPEVDHIDIDSLKTTSPTGRCTIIFHFDRSLPAAICIDDLDQ